MNDIVRSEFHKKLRAYVRRRVNAGAVDDVVSDIVRRLVRSRDQMDGAKDPVAWIYRVAATVITDHYRKSVSEKRLLEKVVLGGPIEDVLVDSRDNINSLAHCLVPMIKSLPAPYDHALLFTEIYGFTQAIVSRQLGLSASAMKSRVQRGRQQLRALLSECCDREAAQRGNGVDYQTRDEPAWCEKSVSSDL
ncbi:MAG: sigma-70 family RNA polymerase sigma factor [Rhodospirillales bacterium]|nr:sigma-70 family RNA polymerase sigma factor [Rhodospirillales bacterium]